MNAIDAKMRWRREMENEEKKAGERCFFCSFLTASSAFLRELKVCLRTELDFKK